MKIIDDICQKLYGGVNYMPGRDGTGPIGARSMTGRGLGFCAGANAVRYSAGFGMRSGLACRHGAETQKQLLQEQKDRLKNRLKVIDMQLENL